MSEPASRLAAAATTQHSWRSTLFRLLAPTEKGATASRKHRAVGLVVVMFFFGLFAVVNGPSLRRKKRVGAGGKNGENDSWNDFMLLLKILLPTARCKEAGILASFVVVLTARTLLSISVAHLDGKVIKSLVEGKFREFVKLSAVWLALGVPASVCNAAIRYLQQKLAFAFRAKLVKHYYDLYLKANVFYKVGNIDDRIENPDQMVADDVEKFSSHLADLISQVAKPVFDCFLFTFDLWKSVGTGGVSGACLTTVLTARLLGYMRPAFGKLTADISEKDGLWRAKHTRLVSDSEEVAFHGGAAAERVRLEGAFSGLSQAHRSLLDKSFWYNVGEGYFTKYLWGIVGCTVCAAPVLLGGSKVAAGDATEMLVTNRKLMANSADSTERLMESLKEVAHLTGRSERLASLHRVLEEVGSGVYRHKQVEQEKAADGVVAAPAADASVHPLLEYHGKVVPCDSAIRFENVPIVAPNGELLVKPVSFEVQVGNHVLITGPNGCGKSSLFRVLAGLWPVVAGELHRPAQAKDIFFLPQRAYLVNGTLRDQIVYPDLVSSKTDEELLQILEWAKCLHVHAREKDGLDSVREWKDVLSGGERQKIGLARVFYHKPKFAILDECTSQIHVDDETGLYQQVKKQGTTILSVSHRRSIWRHHTHSLAFENKSITFSDFVQQDS